MRGVFVCLVFVRVVYEERGVILPGAQGRTSTKPRARVVNARGGAREVGSPGWPVRCQTKRTWRSAGYAAPVAPDRRWRGRGAAPVARSAPGDVDV